jgi:hypothetical protein
MKYQIHKRFRCLRTAFSDYYIQFKFKIQNEFNHSIQNVYIIVELFLGQQAQPNGGKQHKAVRVCLDVII